MTTWIGHQYLSQPECWAQRHLKNQSLYGNKHCWQGSNMTDFETSPDGQGKSCQRKPFEQAKNNLLCMLIRNLKKYRMNRMLCPLESKHRRHLKNQSFYSVWGGVWPLEFQVCEKSRVWLLYFWYEVRWAGQQTIYILGQKVHTVILQYWNIEKRALSNFAFQHC